MTTTQDAYSETAMLHDIRTSNDVRTARSREIVGSFYFCMALGMFFYAGLIAILQAWAIPTRRLQKYLPFGSKTEAGTIYHWIILALVYFAISGGGGFTGYIIMTGLYFILFWVLLIFSWYHRRGLKQKSEEQQDEQHLARTTSATISSGNGSKMDTSKSSIGEDDEGIDPASNPASPVAAAGVNGDSMYPGDGENELNLAVVAPGQVLDDEGVVQRKHSVSPSLGVRGEDDAVEDDSGQFRTVKVSPRPKDNNGGPRGHSSNNLHGASSSSSLGSLRRKPREDNDKPEQEMQLVCSDDAASTVWLSHPYPVTNGQLKCVLLGWVTLLVIFGVICGLIFGYTVHEYKLVAGYNPTNLSSSSAASSTATNGSSSSTSASSTTTAASASTELSGAYEKVEYQPSMTAMALAVMYAFPQVATEFRLALYVQIFSEICGDKFTAKLETDEEKMDEIQVSWIDKYDIDMSIFVRNKTTDYSSVNDWFTRAIKPEARPLPSPASELARSVVSPADSRVLIYQTLAQSGVWVKNSVVSANALIGNLGGSYEDYWNGGSMVISRLAPQDYHRFHAPVDGEIESITEAGETLWSVSADAARSENFAFLNKRKVIIIDGGATVGKVAYIAIGATCVGSVVLQGETGVALKVGDLVTKGQQLGIMQFGGSTVVTLFGEGRVLYNSRLIHRSGYPVETLLQVNQQIGTIG